MKKSFKDVDVNMSSREIPCFDHEKKKVRWFRDENGEVWLSANDMAMGAVGKPNTCGNCIQWRACSIKDRDKCPGDIMPSEFDPTVTDEQREEAMFKYCRHERDQIEQLGLNMEKSFNKKTNNEK